MTLDGGARRRVGRRLAGAPISWGVCEVPGWGRQLPPERVLAEMAGLGPDGHRARPARLPAARRPAACARARPRTGCALVGGFVPLVLHEPVADATRARRPSASPRTLAAAGAEVFVAAVVDGRRLVAARARSTTAQLERVAAHLAELEELVAGHGLALALHPHAGTLVETADDVERLLAATDVGWCLDTGHLLIGGCDPVGLRRATTATASATCT